MKWINEPQDIKDYYGFIYIITNLTSNKKYIGKKFFWKTKKKKPLKGKKNKRLTRVESDWKNYWGSCKELLSDIEKYGKSNFKREIIKCYKTRWDCAYEEIKLQIEKDVLRNKDYYNGIINVRLCSLK